uniref:Uncharacterized protein n=1 Tax=Tanacetum cinerariifolium TaxID=118510 RepID=A0A699JYP3_TANCI|nr:hypothetical protein [Tanacetum cinerariifolium]
MMHGPCGAENLSCPCTVDYKCTKKFPKQFNETTVINTNHYAIYKRRNDDSTIKKNGSDLYNGYVVSYDQGPDKVSATLDDEEVDEIKDYLNCRYVLACEAAWRIYGFDIHYRTPAVEHPPFHLKDEQSVISDATESIHYALDKSYNETKFERWIHHVPPSWGEIYYLRSILNKIKGPMEWDDLKKVDGILYPTYIDACHARGLLQDDKEYIDGLLEVRL